MDECITHGDWANCDQYTDKPTRLRITYYPHSDLPWEVDGIDDIPATAGQGGSILRGTHYTEEVWSYPTFEAAVAGLDEFAKHVGLLPNESEE